MKKCNCDCNYAGNSLRVCSDDPGLEQLSVERGKRHFKRYLIFLGVFLLFTICVSAGIGVILGRAITAALH